MKLSLSVRIAESFLKKEETSMRPDEIVSLAHALGYDAICMRASQVGIHSPPAEVTAMRERLDAAQLPVSMVTGDFAVPQNGPSGPDGLRNITPYLDLTEALGADLIRVCMMVDEDIPWAQRAADEARERGIRLAHQSHLASLFETVEGSVRVLEDIDRPNFGIIYEPANWMLSAQAYAGEAIRRIAPWLMNVYIQNHRIDPAGDTELNSWTRGPVRFAQIGIWEPGGVDAPAVFAALKDVGYEGCVTVHQSFADLMSPEEAARRSYEYLAPLVR